MSDTGQPLPPLVTFSYSAWAALFPEFNATVSEPVATAYSVAAASFIDLTACGPLAGNLALMATALNFVVAHLAQLFTGTSANPATSLVGRVSGASQGSVSVQTDLPASTSALAGWFAQTKYGLTVWAMLAQFRQAFYVPGQACFALPLWGQPGFSGYPQGYPVQYPFLAGR